VSSRNSNLLGAMERAARTDDAGAFDAVLAQVLERARDAADPEVGLQAFVAARLREALGPASFGNESLANESLEEPSLEAASLEQALPGTPDVTGVGDGGGSATSGGALLARRGEAASGGWLRVARAFGLLTAGVAIGFIYGRSPEWWPSDRLPPPEVPMTSTPTEPRATVPPTELRLTLPPTTFEASRANGTPPQADAVSPPADEARPPADSERKAVDTSSPRGTPADTIPPALAPAPLDGSREANAAPRARRSPSEPAPLTRSHAAASVRRASDLAAPRESPDSLRFALEQLRKAQLFLRASEPGRALEALDLLDARVTESVLQEERLVTRTLALCDAGDVAKASALAQRFLERSPDSAYAVSLRESCAGKAALLEQMRERTSNPPR
jgi:hypothetical protein